jgi:hypothetical protein
MEVIVADSQTTLELTLPPAAVHVSPANNARGVGVDTEFRWTPTPNAVYEIVIEPDAPGTTYHVVTSDTQAKIPDLTSVGLSLPKSTNYRWSVISYGPAASVGEITADVVPPFRIGRGFRAVSGKWSFTTAP